MRKKQYNKPTALKISFSIRDMLMAPTEEGDDGLSANYGGGSTRPWSLGDEDNGYTIVR